MNGTNLFKIALRALANNKLRAFLTMLGIIIGVASVITMLAIGQGSKKSIQQQISALPGCLPKSSALSRMQTVSYTYTLSASF